MRASVGAFLSLRVRVRVNRLAPRLPPLHRWVCDESKRLHQLVPPARAAEAAAAAAVLRSGRPPWPLIGRAMTARGVIQAANAVYRFIARHRHRLPGSTPACMTVPPPRAHDAA